MNERPEERDPRQTSLEELAESKPPTLLREFLIYLRQNKKWWLIPFLLALALYGVILVLSLTGGLASIYSLF